MDPVRAGFVASINRPGSNITGVSVLFSALGAKRLELLHELVPNVGVIGMLVNPNVPDTETQLRDAQEAARALGLKLRIENASTGDEIATAAVQNDRELARDSNPSFAEPIAGRRGLSLQSVFSGLDRLCVSADLFGLGVASQPHRQTIWVRAERKSQSRRRVPSFYLVDEFNLPSHG